MRTATLTSKGQITIPKAIRDAMHLRTGDRIAFTLQDDHLVSIKPVTKSVDDVFGKLHHPQQAPLSVSEMNSAVSKRMRNTKP